MPSARARDDQHRPRAIGPKDKAIAALSGPVHTNAWEILKSVKRP